MPGKRISIGPGERASLREIVARAGADSHALAAIAEGRVFVGRRRASDPSEVIAGPAVVEIAEPREVTQSVPVIFENADIVVVDKPAGIPTIADHGGSAHALVAVAAATIGENPSRLHPTSRLDRGVSGVVVFARTKAAADRLARARAEGLYERRYLAVACRAPDPAEGRWTAAIGRARDPRLRKVDGRDPVPAETRYRVQAVTDGGAALLAVAPKTGRTHQIRVHARHAGAPLLGDRDYGGPARVTLASGRVLELRRVALHAARVVVPGADGAPRELTSPVPAELRDLWTALGGDPAAWEVAATCPLP